MTPKEQALEIRFNIWKNVFVDASDAKEFSLITVNYIISANPHSNPLNTSVESTMSYWLEVKQELEKL